MNIEKWTTKMQEAIQKAIKMASEMNHQVVDVEHFLLALFITATINLSVIFKDFFITSKCPLVIGSKLPAYTPILIYPPLLHQNNFITIIILTILFQNNFFLSIFYKIFYKIKI